MITVEEDIALPEKQKRVWEVDFLRGLMILFVVLDHFMFDVSVFCRNATTPFFQALYNASVSYHGTTSVLGVIEKVTHHSFVMMFVFLSGVSSSFSRSNVRRGVKMAVFALAFSAITSAIEAMGVSGVTIWFNVIHVIAVCVLLWSLICFVKSKLTKVWQINLYGVFMALFALACLVVGYCYRYSAAGDLGVFFFLVNNTRSYYYSPADFLPLLPALGWFLIGAFLGQRLYKEKKTLFPTVDPKWVAPLTFCGKYSLWVYFGSQVVMYGFFYLFGWLLEVL